MLYSYLFMTESVVDKPSSYWNGKGRYQKEYEEMYDKLVPSNGEADTVIGELLRKSSRSYYRFYNDGDVKSFGFFIAARPYEKKIKAEMSNSNEYDTWKELLKEFRNNKSRFKYHKGEYRKAMEATVNGLVKYCWKVYQSGKLKNRLVNVELRAPGAAGVVSPRHATKWTLIKSSGELLYLPSKDAAEKYAKRMGWKIHENVRKARKSRR